MAGNGVSDIAHRAQVQDMKEIARLLKPFLCVLCFFYDLLETGLVPAGEVVFSFFFCKAHRAPVLDIKESLDAFIVLQVLCVSWLFYNVQ